MAKTLHQLNVGMLEWWRRECMLRAALPRLSMPPMKAEMWEFFFLIVHLPTYQKKKRDRCQNSELIVLTKPADSSHIFLSSLLSRGFNEKPITCLSWSSLFASASHIPVWFNWVHKDPISSSLVLILFCTVRAIQKKLLRHSLTCLPANFLHHCISTS